MKYKVVVVIDQLICTSEAMRLNCKKKKKKVEPASKIVSFPKFGKVDQFWYIKDPTSILEA